jgi:hypothetical protein
LLFARVGLMVSVGDLVEQPEVVHEAGKINRSSRTPFALQSYKTWAKYTSPRTPTARTCRPTSPYLNCPLEVPKYCTFSVRRHTRDDKLAGRTTEKRA